MLQSNFLRSYHYCSLLLGVIGTLIPHPSHSRTVASTIHLIFNLAPAIMWVRLQDGNEFLTLRDGLAVSVTSHIISNQQLARHGSRVPCNSINQ